MKNFISHKQEVLDELEASMDAATWAIGMAMEKVAKKGETRVDTGRLRNSITFATHRNQGETYSYTDDDGNVYIDQIGFGARKDRVYVGTNVEYAPIHELGGKNAYALHFLRNAVTSNHEKYKAILKAALKD